ncbi:hypothetical protein E9228_001977 [Curtobacterium flaccumfaciens]|uniref:CBU-0592-like domain-containing protein n=1 Tax=Curtobacterium salicis TaxID=1779862 RepID=A0ABX0TC12_9MICO|nr:hypothetical protein [Curtobacterium sp. WW7]NII41330.1 hypothetical protein [Curtobacterium sp. WW7]
MFVGVIEFLGWFGAVTVLAGYLLFSLGKLPNGPVYQLVNLVGGVSVAVNVAAHHAVPSTIVNAIWAGVAAVVLVRMLGRRRRPDEPAVLSSGHIEPPTTTAVLPVVGPALRDHETVTAKPDEADTAGTVEPAPSLQDVSGAAADAPAPMTETVPVITATIALALVRAAAEQHATQQHATQQHATQQRLDTAAEPERADAP